MNAPRTAALPTLSLALAVSCLTGCPSTTATPIAIESATPVPADPAPPSFKLDVRGHGFGLRGLSFNLGHGSGTTAEPKLRTEIVNRQGLAPREIQGTTTVIVSSTQLDVEVTLGGALAPDAYGVRLYEESEITPVAELPNAFEIGGTPPPQDAGPQDGVVTPDGGAPGDGTIGNDAVDPGDAGGGQDAFFFDATNADGGPADSGLGDFLAGYNFRQRIILENTSAAEAAAGVTFRLSVPHQFLVASGRSRADGADLAVALDGVLLSHQFEDAAQLGQPDIYLIVRMTAPIPIGTPNLNLVLYYGDPNATLRTSDSVFEYAERFANALPGSWQDAWQGRCNDRVLQAAQPLGSECTTDANTANPVRRTLGSPNIATLRSTGPANEIYELAAFVGGFMAEGNSDLLYFAYSNNISNFAGAVILPTSAYIDFPPNAQLTFTETTNAPRTADGWRFATNQPFVLTRARFRPTMYDQPSLHFRYISANGTNPGGTLVGLDDLTVRRAVEPELGAALDPTVESRF